MPARIATGSTSPLIPAILLALVALAAPWPTRAQEGQAQLERMRGPGTAPIGDGLAEIDLGEEYVLRAAGDTQRMLELGGNPVNGTELATVAPLSDAEQWILIFEWDDIGYVEDDEAEDLDAETILEVEDVIRIRTGERGENAV